jgi:Cu/Ag efflux pump CusA
VIGGLLFATFATLIFVPTMYQLLRRRPETVSDSNATGTVHATG